MIDTSAELIALQAALAGEYSLQREIGRGGMGVVYLARDVQLDRDVAIKVLPAHLATTADARDRFIREARTAAGLSHPHIVPIHRVGEAGGFVFFVMTYVEGETLGQRIRSRGLLPAADAARVMREVAWALAYAHGRGIVHRDIKPDNILLEAGTGRALVTDFGIAHVGSAATQPGGGPMMGTAHFMSPEMAASEPFDGRSDIYALGVVGYLAVSGRLPFETTSVPKLLVRQATEAAPAVARVAPGLTPALAAAIDRCLARDPARRFPDGEALADALAPKADNRPALPSTLRAWVSARNPLLVPYLGWSGAFGTLGLVNLGFWVTGNRPDGPADIVLLAAIASLPLFPLVGFHLVQAHRQFRVGHSLADLRTAIAVARQERLESDRLRREEDDGNGHRALRLATVASTTWLGVTFGLVVQGVIHESQVGIGWVAIPLLTTMALGAISNAVGVRFIPPWIREWWQTGIRDRLWRGRLGEWFAKRLGAAPRSGVESAAAFRPTEAALGLAASELYAALPKSYKAQLEGLPEVVAALEARATAARAELDVVGSLVPSGERGFEMLRTRQDAAASQLAQSVAALESIRLDLLRLHADATEMAPLTTLMNAAELLGADVARLASARREADAALEAGRLTSMD